MARYIARKRFWQSHSLLLAFFFFSVPHALAMPPNPAHEQMLKFTGDQRNAAMTLLLQKSGEKCNRATRTFFQKQDADGRAYWDVECANSRSYKVRINADLNGSTLITDCALMKRLTGTACFESIKDLPKGWKAGS